MRLLPGDDHTTGPRPSRARPAWRRPAVCCRDRATPVQRICIRSRSAMNAPMAEAGSTRCQGSRGTYPKTRTSCAPQGAPRYRPGGSRTRQARRHPLPSGIGPPWHRTAGLRRGPWHRFGPAGLHVSDVEAGRAKYWYWQVPLSGNPAGTERQARHRPAAVVSAGQLQPGFHLQEAATPGSGLPVPELRQETLPKTTAFVWVHSSGESEAEILP